MLRLGRWSICVFIHIHPYGALFYARLVLVFSTFSGILSIILRRIRKKRAHFCRLPTHIHTYTLQSERRSHRSHTACHTNTLVSRNSSHTHTSTFCTALTTTTTITTLTHIVTVYAWPCLLYKRGNANQNKIYRQLLSATHTNVRTHAHFVTRPVCARLCVSVVCLWSFARSKTFVCMFCLYGRHDSSTAVTLSETAIERYRLCKGAPMKEEQAPFIHSFNTFVLRQTRG